MNSELIALCIQTGVASLVIGDSGIGKTEVVAQIADKLKRKHEAWSMAQLGREDFTGIMVPNKETKVADLYPISLGRTLTTPEAQEAGGVLILDELASAPSRTRGAALTLIQSRMLGSHKLPDSISFVALSNHPEKAEGGSDFRAAVSSRFCWVYAEYDVKATTDYFRGGPGFLAKVPLLPSNWREGYLRSALSIVASFIERNVALANAEPPPHDAAKPFPCPRAWENTAKLLAAVRAIGKPYNSDLAYAAVAGCVGEGAASAFQTWLRAMNLPDPEQILSLAVQGKTKEAFELIPSRADQFSVALDSVAVSAVSPHAQQAERWHAAWKLMGKVFADHQDIAMATADILAMIPPPDGKFPAEAQQIFTIRRQANLALR